MWFCNYESQWRTIEPRPCVSARISNIGNFMLLDSIAMAKDVAALATDNCSELKGFICASYGKYSEEEDVPKGESKITFGVVDCSTFSLS